MPSPTVSDRQQPVPHGASAPSAGPSDDAGRRARTTARLLAEIAASTDDEERQRLRAQVIELNMRLARAVARRYRNRGIGHEDLDQVAYLGLVKAVDSFDVGNRSDFHSYAVPTMRGEVRRHFRDCGWTVRPPRQIQEQQRRISVASQELQQELGRSPRPSELAARLGDDEELVIEALMCTGAFAPASLDAPAGEDGSLSLSDRLAGEDAGLARAEDRMFLARAVGRLALRDRRIIELRYLEEWTQERIGRELGITQVQVSRVLARILRDLRRALVDDDGAVEVRAGTT
ncbi:MAG: sigma-70 family RNA polymerase sigma factor [Nocardioidaceae bacterium]